MKKTFLILSISLNLILFPTVLYSQFFPETLNSVINLQPKLNANDNALFGIATYSIFKDRFHNPKSLNGNYFFKISF